MDAEDNTSEPTSSDTPTPLHPDGYISIQFHSGEVATIPFKDMVTWTPSMLNGMRVLLVDFGEQYTIWPMSDVKFIEVHKNGETWVAAQKIERRAQAKAELVKAGIPEEEIEELLDSFEGVWGE
jgi:hypothetical protein